MRTRLPVGASVTPLQRGRHARVDMACVDRGTAVPGDRPPLEDAQPGVVANWGTGVASAAAPTFGVSVTPRPLVHGLRSAPAAAARPRVRTRACRAYAGAAKLRCEQRLAREANSE